MEDAPLISIVVPCRNERDYIARCLDAIIANDWPAYRTEILVVDGMSEDGTRDIVAAYAARHPQLRLVDNADRVTPRAMNLGIRAARGAYVVRVDAHAEIPPDYFSRGARILQDRPDVWAVGGPVTRVGEGRGGRLVAAVTSHGFAAGNARVRVGAAEGAVDAVLYPVWRADVFKRVGLFDEDLVRNQDDDFHLRIRLAGGVIYQTSAMRARYYVRGSAAKLLRQYAQYGFWKIVVARKHGRFADWKPMAPLAFYAFLALAGALSFVFRPVALGVAVLLGVYLGADVVAASAVGLRLGARAALGAAVTFPALHFAYAYGMLRGIWTCYVARLTAADIRARGLFGGLTR